MTVPGRLPRDHGATTLPTRQSPDIRGGPCPHGGAPLGFTGWLGYPDGGGTAEVACSCGGRHMASGPVRLGVFAAAGAPAETSFDPTSGVLRRGPLSQVPVYYTVVAGEHGDLVRFSTSIAEVAGATAEPWPAAVAALLAGQAIPVPFTLYEEVFRLACGTALRVAEGRQRLALESLDLAAAGLRVGGRTDASAVLREALAAALSDARAGVVGDGGGLGAAGLAAAAPGLPRVHVHVGLPVLKRRRWFLDTATEVVDATPAWEGACDCGRPPYPGEADPWPDHLEEHPGGRARAASGRGLEPMLTGMPRRRGRLRAGWRALTAAEPPADLAGAAWWRAWRGVPKAEAHDHAHPLPEPGDDEPGGPGDDEPGELVVVRPWLDDSLRKAASAASQGQTESHLLEGDHPGRRALRVVLEIVDGLGAVPAPHGEGASAASPVLIAAHPMVVGTVAALAAAGRLEPRHRDGCQVPAPPLVDLVPVGWQPADVAPADRERLFAAALVTRRLGTAAARRMLLERVASSPWVDAEALAPVLADRDAVLSQAPALNRLYATALRYPGVLAHGDG